MAELTATSAASAHSCHSRAPATPGEFLEWLHGDVRHRVGVVQKYVRPDGEERWTDAYWLARDNRALLHELVATIPDGRDTYAMLNETRAWRNNRYIRCIKACVVDLDAHDPSDPQPATLVHGALEALKKANVPPPHLIVYTGRGAQLLWRLRRVGLTDHDWNATARWTLVQRHLAALCGQHADNSLVDLARLIRVPGTINTKVRRGTRITRSEWGPAKTESVSFDELADAVLPEAREIVRPRNLRFREGKRDSAVLPNTAGPRKVHRPRRSRESTLKAVAARRLEDYKLIAQACAGRGIPTGCRDKFLFAVACDLAWVTPLALASSIDKHIINELATLGVVANREARRSRAAANPPLTIGQGRGYIGSVVRRFKAAANGTQLEFRDSKRDPRYWNRSSKVYADLKPLLETLPGLTPRLQELVPDELGTALFRARCKRSKAASDAARDRVSEGRYAKRHAEDGVRRHAVAAVKAGSPLKEVAARCDVTPRTVANWVKKDAAGALAHPEAPPENRVETEKSPELYMAQPVRISVSANLQGVVAGPDCGQANGLSIKEGPNPECGACRNPLAGCPQAPSCGQRQDPHGRCRQSGGTEPGLGGGPGEGRRNLSPSPVDNSGAQRSTNSHGGQSPPAELAHSGQRSAPRRRRVRRRSPSADG